MTADHKSGPVALPFCEACGQPITFYMHQQFDHAVRTMRYYHPTCCPTCNARAASDAVIQPLADEGLKYLTDEGES